MALLFGAVNSDRVDCGANFANWTDLTVLAWVYATSTAAPRGIVGHFRGADESGWELFEGLSEGSLDFGWGGSTYCAARTGTYALATLNTWLFVGVAATFS